MYKKVVSSVVALGMLALLGAGCVKKNPPSTTSALPPSISVLEQSLGTDNQLVIANATTDDNSWVVIHEKKDGQPGAMLGYTSLATGSTSKIKITIDKTNISPSLIAMLHYDRGEKGVFEFPGADGPIIRDRQVIMQEFNISNYAEITKTTSPAPASARKEFIITAKQWSFSPSEIKVQKGDTVVIKLKSTDVTHGISIPAFGINETIKPGETKTIEFVVDKTGTFEFICNIPCGVGHRGMTGTIVVE